MTESAGDLIMITGPSGVGKSTIAGHLHQRLGGEWLLWQSDRCQPKHHALSSHLTREEGLELEQRMFAANVGAIAAYLNNNWSVVAELAVLTATEVEAVRRATPGRTMLVQLSCSPDTLAAHLQERDSPVPRDWAVNFYEQWRDVDLPGAVKIGVDGTTPTQAVNRILEHRMSFEA